MTEALFDATPYLMPEAAGELPEQLSAGRRLTLRQAADLARGVHPLTHGPLHPDAAPADDRSAPGLRCGTCRFREVIAYHNRSYGKCVWPNPDGDLNELPRVTHSAASDVRAWWPSCGDYQRHPRMARAVVTVSVSEVLR